MEEETKKKDELLERIEKMKNEARQHKLLGGKMVEQGQFWEDMSAAHKRFVKAIPDDSYISGENWEKQTGAWGKLGDEFHKANEAHSFRIPISAAVSGTSGFMNPNILVKALSGESGEEIKQSIALFTKVAQKADWVDEAEKHIVRLKLDKTVPGRKNSLELLREARQAYLKPTSEQTTPGAVLIPIREAINVAVADLLRRRPYQENAKAWSAKVRSIGTHCGNFQGGDLDSLASDIEQLINDLSGGGKQKDMNRDEVGALFMRACSFLKAFLEWVDESKLKA